MKRELVSNFHLKKHYIRIIEANLHSLVRI